MSKEALIVRDDAGHKIQFGSTAEARKGEALTAGLSVNQVTNYDEQKQAVEVQRSLHILVADVEKERKRIKAPVLAFGKLIDSTAKEWVQSLVAEQGRIAGIVSEFAAKEEEKRRQAEREAEEKRRAEMAKIEAERREAERKLQEDENKRLAELRAKQEEAAKANKAKQEEAAKAVREAEEKAAKDRERVAAELRAKEKKVLEATTVAAPTKATGQRVKKEWKITVVNAADLARHHPEMVTITPKLMEIKDALNEGRTVVGIHSERVVKSSVSARGGRAIEV